MADTSDDFKVEEVFENAPLDDEERAKAEKRAEKLKRREASKEEKEEQRRINRENREKKKKLKEKNKKRKRGEEVSDDDEDEQAESGKNKDKKTGKKSKKDKQAEEYGVWVGNLAFATSQEGLQKYFADCGEVTRVKCPKGEGRQKQNKGFAYVMFKEEASVEKAIAKSEEKLDGRPLLIKNAKSFERKDGIQPPTKESKKQKNPPCPTLFVGNLGFSTTKQQLQEHFAFAGDIRQVRLGTFEDSGKCKGFGYVDYVTVESATKAIRAPDKHTLDDRKIRVEFASEEAHKRSMPWMLRREKADQKGTSNARNNSTTPASQENTVSSSSSSSPSVSTATTTTKDSNVTEDQPQQFQRNPYADQRRQRKEQSSFEKKPQHQGRLKPGEALSQAQRQKPTVQEFKGTKIVF